MTKNSLTQLPRSILYLRVRLEKKCSDDDDDDSAEKVEEHAEDMWVSFEPTECSWMKEIPICWLKGVTGKY